jgi:dTDP-4-amino-4,6-dideoxygalactose transaminase
MVPTTNGATMVRPQLDRLAILGGMPAFSEPLHVGRPNIGERDQLLLRLQDILDRQWLTNGGKYVQEFEREVEKRLAVKHCVAMCNGTVALEIAIRALGLTGEVIVPSFTFVATAHALQWQEITPVFCDIDARTHTLDPMRVEQMITPRTTGIIGVHLWGVGCDVEALTEIANCRGLKLLFDAAHAFGCGRRGRMIGSFGNAEVFSFHATKCVNTFEGGAVTTNDDQLAEKIRLMKNFGFTNYDQADHIGINGKMNEFSAAMGLTNLESMEDFVAANRANHELYCELLGGVPGLTAINYDSRDQNTYHYVVVEVEPGEASLTRDELVQVLHAERVLARRYFYPGCHRMEPYRSHFPHAGLLLPQTERMTERVLCLPTGPSVVASQIETVCGLIRLALDNAQEIRRILDASAAFSGKARCNLARRLQTH